MNTRTPRHIIRSVSKSNCLQVITPSNKLIWSLTRFRSIGRLVGFVSQWTILSVDYVMFYLLELDGKHIACPYVNGHDHVVAQLLPKNIARLRNAHVANPSPPPLPPSTRQVMTAPRQPEPPVIIRSQRRSIVVKWYPGIGGAFKYHLQSRLVETLDGVGALAEATRLVGGVGGVAGRWAGRRKKAWGEGGDEDNDVGGGWATVYEGVDSTAKVMKERTREDEPFLFRLIYQLKTGTPFHAPLRTSERGRRGGSFCADFSRRRM